LGMKFLPAMLFGVLWRAARRVRSRARWRRHIGTHIPALAFRTDPRGSEEVAWQRLENGHEQSRFGSCRSAHTFARKERRERW